MFKTLRLLLVVHVARKTANSFTSSSILGTIFFSALRRVILFNCIFNIITNGLSIYLSQRKVRRENQLHYKDLLPAHHLHEKNVLQPALARYRVATDHFSVLNASAFCIIGISGRHLPVQTLLNTHICL